MSKKDTVRVGALTVRYTKINEDQAPLINPKQQRVREALRKLREAQKCS